MDWLKNVQSSHRLIFLKVSPYLTCVECIEIYKPEATQKYISVSTLRILALARTSLNKK